MCPALCNKGITETRWKPCSDLKLPVLAVQVLGPLPNPHHDRVVAIAARPNFLVCILRPKSRQNANAVLIKRTRLNASGSWSMQSRLWKSNVNSWPAKFSTKVTLKVSQARTADLMRHTLCCPTVPRRPQLAPTHHIGAICKGNPRLVLMSTSYKRDCSLERPMNSPPMTETFA